MSLSNISFTTQNADLIEKDPIPKTILYYKTVLNVFLVILSWRSNIVYPKTDPITHGKKSSSVPVGLSYRHSWIWDLTFCLKIAKLAMLYFVEVNRNDY
jgi:hypothetical protein